VSETNPSPAPDPAPEPALIPVPTPASPPPPPSPPVDLKRMLLPAEWTLAQLEAEARKVYFGDLVPNPPQTPVFRWLDPLPLTVAGTEGGFQKVFGETTGWAQYHHYKTGKLDKERLRRARWIRPVLEMLVPKTKIYVNNHSMKPRQFGANAQIEKKRLFVTTGAEVLYLISLVYTKPAPGLALATAYAPNGSDLREMLKKHGTTLLGP
jgi:hypothetical protein